MRKNSQENPGKQNQKNPNKMGSGREGLPGLPDIKASSKASVIKTI